MLRRSQGLRHADQPDSATQAKNPGRSSPGLPGELGPGPALTTAGPAASERLSLARTSMPSPLATAKAIARALRAARQDERTPEAVVLSPDLHAQLRSATIGILVSSTSKPDSMFGVPVEIDPDVEGWVLRTR